MNKKHFLSLSQKYDQTGDYKQTAKLIKEAQYNQSYLHKSNSKIFQGTNPFINTYNSPEF